MRNNERLMNINVSKYDVVYLRANVTGRRLPFFHYAFIIMLCFIMAGCASTKGPVPVVDKGLNDTTVRSIDGVNQKEGDYIVQ